MNQAVYDRLVSVAKACGLISYSELSKIIGLDLGRRADMEAMVTIMEEIALNEMQVGRPLLVAVVIRDDTKMPGKGLFTFAKEHGLQKDNDEVAFFTKELSRVYQQWST